ncbi:MAG: hypothetical protein M1840_000223 [Geoglossum simile]|nr:MAG: hypothetical protein M1840_000223 [Geoglossum simile]
MNILQELSLAVSGKDLPICIYCVVPDKVELKYCKREFHKRSQMKFFNYRSQELATCQECLSSLVQLASQQPESSGPIRGRAELPENVAVSSGHWKLIENFREALKKERLDTCSRYQERWFNLKLDVNSVRERCCKSRDKEDKQPYLVNDNNKIDLNEVPIYLPELS